MGKSARRGNDMKSRDNYFLILGLDYRKKDYTDEEIRQCINEKCRCWSDNCECDAKNGDDYKKYVRQFIDIEDTMLDPVSRAKEAADAEYFVEEYLKDAMAAYEGKDTIGGIEAEAICEGGNISPELFQELTGMTIAEETEGFRISADIPDPEKEELQRIQQIQVQCDRLSEQAESSRSEEEVCRLVDEIRAISSDYPVKDILKKFRLLPPVNCTAEVTPEGTVRLFWEPSPSPGNITYRAVRKIGSFPQNFKEADWDKSVGRACSTEDTGIKNGQTGFYYVFSCREGIYSAPARVKITNLQEISGLACRPGDGCVMLSWDTPPENAGVMVVRKNHSVPVSTMDGDRIRNVESPWTDEVLENNQTYGYRICLFYEIGGKTMITEGVTAMAVPRAVPEPVRDYTIETENRGLYMLRWETIDREHTEFYYIEGENCPWKEGQTYIRENFENYGLEILSPVQRFGHGFTFSVPSGRKYCIIPVVYNEELIIFGRSSVIWNIPAVEVKRVEVHGSDLELSFKWPEGVDEVVAKYGHARYTASFDEEGFQSVRINVRQYMSAEELKITNVKREEYYISLYACVFLAGKQTMIDIGHIYHNNEPKTIIRYTVSVKGIFSRKKAEIRFTCPGRDSFELDEIEIYAQQNSVPYYKNSSTCIMSLPARRADRSCVIEISLDGMEKNTFIRPFFRYNKSYERVVLEETEDSKPRIK